MTEQIIEYNVTKAALAELTEERERLLSAPEHDLLVIGEARKRNSKIRVAVEKRRKELKSDALAYGRKVDSKAKEVSEPVTANEEAYNVVLKKHEAELEAIRVAYLNKENARIAGINLQIESIRVFRDRVTYNTTAAEVNALITEFDNFIMEKFDYAEFKNQAHDAVQATEGFLFTKVTERAKYEAEQAAQEAQRKIDEESRAALEAAKAEFAAQQKEAQDKIDAERAALRKERADQIQVETERKQKEQQAVHDEIRKKHAETEQARLAQIAKDEAERKAKQAAEDRVRNAAPELLLVLEEVVNSDMAMREEDEGNKSPLLTRVRMAIKLATGEQKNG